MTIYQQGQLNTTALIVPDLYIQIVPPSTYLLNGVPTNILGVVGTASWGPVNSPTIVGNMAQYAQLFGPVMPRKYDAGTAVACAVLQGAQNFRIVRVTDGTDVAATITLGTTGISITSKYTGSMGNLIQVTMTTGSAAGSFKLVVGMPGQVPEQFDNIVGSGNTFWQNLATAINNGQSGLRGPSRFVVATAGPGAQSPTLATFTLIGGTDGAASVNASLLVGQDTIPRKGMYALRNQGVSVAMLADSDDTTQWANQTAFGLSEGIYMILVGPQGDSIANAISTLDTAGIDSYAAKVMFGDWIYWADTVNNQVRLVSPQGFIAGLLSNLSPQNSTLNKQLFGIVGTQKTSQNQVYSYAEIQALASAGLEVITNPVPGGNYYAARLGHNTSSNAVIHGDNYTRMTNYIASTLNAGMGKFVGQLQSKTTQQQAKATLDAFLSNMWDQGQIGNSTGTIPFQVVLDSTNNPQSRVALGYMQADVKIQYLSVIEFLLVNIQGGQSVTIDRLSTQPNA